ncbi:tetratricopeptide repeat protein [Streptomyces sp. VRA16 Mangrove soil]|uniref:ATP-binding protein n=1 Tax=Streptomyces sp. VRA16 Mangrove soil TaxID=2817434 RepID=UPI001A9FB213|nr:helix-turn-helix domain-containing protein [Streptomyces sp. VRA16 Mangrove soil]MBO1330004.1 tetratricopeptide repeat protein [Streptomyces sp. VRA16 Mangrove soil]
METGTSFGALLREARQHSLLTLEGLAETSGVSARAISDMERGRSLPRRATLGELLDALGLDEEARRRMTKAASARRPASAPRQLPPDLALFRGRRQALATVHGVVSPVVEGAGPGVIAAIGGMAGVGKTTLAVHWAHQVADRFPDGQLYVNLRGFEDTRRPLDPNEALGTFLTALGTPSGELPRATDERSALFRQLTVSKRLIVLLDNARDAEQVRPLLPASAASLTIVTSRNRLSGLAATEGATLIGLDVWGRDEAVTALAARIGGERCRAEPEAAVDLVELCGRLPLAVAVIGAQLSASPELSLRRAVRELAEARLDALSADDRRADVRAVFSWSYRALPAATARVFRHVALHPGPATSVEAAASLVGIEVAPVRRHLRELTAASLLAQDADGRYVLHDLVRAYGVELVEQEGDDRTAAEMRLLDYLRHNAYTAGLFVSRYKDDPPGAAAEGVARVVVGSRAEALDWYAREESTTAAALRHLADPRLRRHLLDLALEWVGYNAVAGRWTELIAAQGVALEAALALDDPTGVVRSCANLGRALIELGHPDDADEPTAVLLAHLPRLPAALRARAELNVGWLRDRQDRLVESCAHARNALALYRSLDAPDKVGRALADLGWVLARLGEHRQAIATCEEAVPLLRAAGDRRFEAAVWQALGVARQGLGELDAAVDAYEASLRLFGEVLDDYGRAEVWDLLASALLERGDTARARAGWLRSAELLGALRVARAAQMRAKAEALSGPDV